MEKYICRKENDHYLIYNRTMDKIYSYNSIQEIYKNYGKEHIDLIENSLTANAFSFPFKLFLDISNHCNLNCIHCLSESAPNNTKYLNEELIEKIIHECCQYGIFQVKIGGGEPLLYPDFWNVVDKIRNISSVIRVSFSTNGTILQQKDIENIKKYNCDVSVSLDGNHQIHNLIRKQNIYEQVLCSIDMMINSGIYPVIRYTLMDLNLHCVLEIYNYCQQKGLQLKIRRYKPTSEDDKCLLTYGRDYYKLVEVLRNLSNCDIEDIMKNKRDNSKILYCSYDCGAAFRSIHVDCFGNISPCVFLGDRYKIGNVECDSIKFLWDNSKILKALRERGDNIQCMQCSKKYVCHGECLGVKIFYDDNILGVDRGCFRKE